MWAERALGREAEDQCSVSPPLGLDPEQEHIPRHWRSCPQEKQRVSACQGEEDSGASEYMETMGTEPAGARGLLDKAETR